MDILLNNTYTNARNNTWLIFPFIDKIIRYFCENAATNFSSNRLDIAKELFTDRRLFKSAVHHCSYRSFAVATPGVSTVES